MSLSSLLLGSKSGIDKELDGLFKATVPKAASASAPTAPAPGPSKLQAVPGKKRKQVEEKEASPAKTPKRAKTSEKAAQEAAQLAKTPVKSSPKEGKKTKEKKGKGKQKETQPPAEVDEDDVSDIENAYAKEQDKKMPKVAAEQLEVEAEANADDENEVEDDDDDKVDPSTLVHESLDPKSRSNRKPKPKAKVVPQDETPERRDQRTIFIGNLPLEIVSKKPLSKQLQRHILSFVPTAKVESLRFRSIPFQAPTAKLPTSDDEDGKPSKPPIAFKGRAHDRERMSAWRSKLDQEDDDSIQKDEKKFLTPGQKKKVAYINQEFHTTADSVNAYLVFAHAPNTENRPANLPPLPDVLDPYEAARLAVAKADGTLFMERMIRVDLVSKDKTQPADATKDGEKQVTMVVEDPKLSVFVGNLDFASKEEDLRVFFEGIVAGERGPPDVALKGDAVVDPSKPLTWVTRVRIIRDKDTQLGKGFAYIQFADRACVDELLAMDQDKLKFAKRKLRVQRCKTLPGSSVPINTEPKGRSWTAVARPVVVIPKGNPELGATIAALSKEERKKVKSTDSDRLARRLAKKRARASMKPSVKPTKTGKPSKTGKPGKAGSGKDRKRVRS